MLQSCFLGKYFKICEVAICFPGVIFDGKSFEFKCSDFIYVESDFLFLQLSLSISINVLLLYLDKISRDARKPTQSSLV